MSRERRLVVSMIAIVMLGAVPRVSAQARAAAACDEWSEPQPIRTAAGELVQVDRPTAIALPSGDLLLFGEPAFILVTDSPLRFDLAGFRVSRGVASPIELPPGLRANSRRFFGPRVARTSDDVVHVVWGSAGDTLDARAGIADTIWHSRLAGARLTEPEVVLTGNGIFWAQDGVADLIAVDSSLHVAMTGYDAGTPGKAILLATLAGDRWTRQPLPRESIPNYARLAHDGSGLILVWSPFRGLRLERPGPSPANWTEIARFDAREQSDIITPQLLTLGERELLLAWIDEPGRMAPPGNTTIVEVARSSDGGRSWRKLTTRGPSVSFFRNLQASSADPESPILAVEGGRGEVFAAVVAGDTVIFRRVTTGMRGMAVLRALRGRSTLFWARSQSDPSLPSITVWSEWHGCARLPRLAPRR